MARDNVQEEIEMYKVMGGTGALLVTDNLDLAYCFYEHARKKSEPALYMGPIDKDGNVIAFPQDYLENLRQEWEDLSPEERDNRMNAVREAWEEMKEENS